MRIEWYGPPKGQNSVEHVVSYTDSVHSGLRRYSSRLRMDAAAILEMTEHRPNQERAEIGVVYRETPNPHGDETWLDSIVYLQAPNVQEQGEGEGGKDGKTNSYAAVQSIEFGHYTRPRDHDGEGPRTKSDHRRSWVPGVAPLRRAAKKMSANPKLSIR